jgi:hypothetical protein
MLAGSLIPGPDAAGAKVETNCNPIDGECRSLNIGEPGSPGMLFGLAYPIAEPQRFSTNITFDSQF